MAEQQQEPLRADAQHNRERILAAARDLLSAGGDASLNSIAKKAGVGPGTLYRHFPNRESLVLAVYRYDVQQLADAAPKLLAGNRPAQALRLWFDRLAHYSMIKHGLADVLHAATSEGLASETYEPVVGAVTLLLTACEQDGSIRPGHDPDDVLLMLGFLWRIDPGPGAAAKASRLLDVVMAGLSSDTQQAGPRPATAGRRSRRQAQARRVSPASLLSLLRTRR